MGNSSTKRYRKKSSKVKRHTNKGKTQLYRNKRTTIKRRTHRSKRHRRRNTHKKRGRKQRGGGAGFGYAGDNVGPLHGGHHPVSSYNTC